jgi:TrpR-related protein YerC/YecD
LTEEEIISLAQRLRIAKLILKGKTYTDISTQLEASTATITKIGQVIKYGKKGLDKIIR